RHAREPLVRWVSVESFRQEPRYLTRRLVALRTGSSGGCWRGSVSCACPCSTSTRAGDLHLPKPTALPAISRSQPGPSALEAWSPGLSVRRHFTFHREGPVAGGECQDASILERFGIANPMF